MLTLAQLEVRLARLDAASSRAAPLAPVAAAVAQSADPVAQLLNQALGELLPGAAVLSWDRRRPGLVAGQMAADGLVFQFGCDANQIAYRPAWDGLSQGRWEARSAGFLAARSPGLRLDAPGAGGKKRCSRGYGCGNSCISLKNECRLKVSSAAINAAAQQVSEGANKTTVQRKLYAEVVAAMELEFKGKRRDGWGQSTADRFAALEARIDAARKKCSTGYGCGSTCISLRKECRTSPSSSTGKERLKRLLALAGGGASDQRGIAPVRAAEATALAGALEQRREEKAQQLKGTRQKATAEKPQPPPPAPPYEAKRSRPKQAIHFPDPIEGPSGAKLTGYTWQWTLTEDVDKRGEVVEKRISDWEKSIANPETGRNVVHQFEVEKDGKTSTVSAESALRLMGYTNETDRKAFGSLKSAARTVARLRMAQQELDQVEKRWQKDWDEVEALPRPGIKVGEWRQGDGEYSHRTWEAGGVKVQQLRNSLGVSTDQEQTAELMGAWKGEKMAGRGWDWTGQQEKRMRSHLGRNRDDLAKRLIKAEANLAAKSKMPAPPPGNGKPGVKVEIQRAKPGGEYGPDGHWYPGGAWMSQGQFVGGKEQALGSGEQPASATGKEGSGASQRVIRNKEKPRREQPTEPKGKGLDQPVGLKKTAAKNDEDFFNDRGFVLYPRPKGAAGLNGTLFDAAVIQRMSTEELGWATDQILTMGNVKRSDLGVVDDLENAATRFGSEKDYLNYQRSFTRNQLIGVDDKRLKAGLIFMDASRNLGHTSPAQQRLRTRRKTTENPPERKGEQGDWVWGLNNVFRAVQLRRDRMAAPSVLTNPGRQDPGLAPKAKQPGLNAQDVTTSTQQAAFARQQQQAAKAAGDQSGAQAWRKEERTVERNRLATAIGRGNQSQSSLFGVTEYDETMPLFKKRSDGLSRWVADILEARIDALRRKCQTGYSCGSTCISLQKECRARPGSAISRERLERLQQLAKEEVAPRGLGVPRGAAATALATDIQERRRARAAELTGQRAARNGLPTGPLRTRYSVGTGAGSPATQQPAMTNSPVPVQPIKRSAPMGASALQPTVVDVEVMPSSGGLATTRQPAAGGLATPGAAAGPRPGSLAAAMRASIEAMRQLDVQQMSQIANDLFESKWTVEKSRSWKKLSKEEAKAEFIAKMGQDMQDGSAKLRREMATAAASNPPSNRPSKDFSIADVMRANIEAMKASDARMEELQQRTRELRRKAMALELGDLPDDLPQAAPPARRRRQLPKG